MYAFYRKGTPESSSAGKETVDIDILVTSKNCNRKIMQSITITRPLTERKGNQFSQLRLTSPKVIPKEKT